MIWGWNPGSSKRCFFPPNCLDWLWGATQPPIQWVPGFFSGRKVVKLTTHLYLVPRFRMSGAVHFLRVFAFIEWTRTTLPFHLFLCGKTSLCKLSWTGMAVYIISPTFYICYHLLTIYTCQFLCYGWKCCLKLFSKILLLHYHI